MRRLLVAGSRGFEAIGQASINPILDNAYSTLFRSGAQFSRDMIVVHGGARGVDQMAGTWADGPVEVHPADWDTYGKSAGYRRNAEMVAIADAAIIVWDGESKGTKHTIDLMTASGKPFVLVVKPL